MRQQSIIDLHLICREGDKVLLQLRQNTGYADGNYHLPAGHLEAGEDAITGICREAMEELGIDLHKPSLFLSFTLHQNSGGSRIGLFFEADRWSGTPLNREAGKCAELAWFSLSQLPGNTVPYARFSLMEMAAGRRFGTFGW